MLSFKARIEMIGVNPYVLLPQRVLKGIFVSANRDKGPIPVKGKIDGHAFIQTLVRYAGHWRLYLNNLMRTAAGKDVGDRVQIEIAFDPAPREIAMHPKLKMALETNQEALTAFEALAPSRKKEIVRYINSLKREITIDMNVKRAIGFLLKKERFVGRDV